MKFNDFKAKINEIEKKIGYTFKDKSLLVQSFTRTSYCNEYKASKGNAPQSNEVLEFIGDGVLSVSIITSLMTDLAQRYSFGLKTELGEGDFSNIKSKLSDKRNLSVSCAALGLEKYLIMGEGDEKLGISSEPSVMEDLFESIIGAIYVDSGYSMDSVMLAVKKMLDMSVYKSDARARGSAKNELQEWCADKKRRLPPPEYKTVSEDGPDHRKTYTRAVYVDGKMIATGVGKNLKLADAACATSALEILTKGAQNAKLPQENSTRVAGKGENAQNSKTRAKLKAPTKNAPIQQPKAPTSEELLAAPQRLKDIAASKKAPLPRFRDLGSDGKVWRIECTFLNCTEIGEGEDRRIARATAAYRIISEIKKKKKK